MFYRAPTAEFRKSFHQGANRHAYKTYGAHLCAETEKDYWHFCVWAPNAKKVSLIGQFNLWDSSRHPMFRTSDGSWEIRLTNDELYSLQSGNQLPAYQYAVLGADDKWRIKADPFAFSSQLRPANASLLYDAQRYQWHDSDWLLARSRKDLRHSPVNVYELHAGSWKRHTDGSFLTYSELADQLIPYVRDMGYTHIELLPIMEHPLDRSWGYQSTGYFCATSRHGSPDELKELIDRCHQAKIGVILDWVPAHFPRDEFGLFRFDGTDLYNHPDAAVSELPLWGTLRFDFSRGAVRSFLLSSACFWLEEYHADGIRVDAVSTILYDKICADSDEVLSGKQLLYPNQDGADFLRFMNQTIHRDFPGVMMIAEESSAFPNVTGSVEEGGLGFDFKWNMGWMNDTLAYVKQLPAQRKDHHNLLTFGLTYAFDEHFILALSHDESVYAKGSLLSRQPGNLSLKHSGLRAMYGYMMAHPGKKLLFMGGEFGQTAEWDYAGQLHWFLSDDPLHRSLQACVRQLNHLYREQPSLYEDDDSWHGFQWLEANDAENSVLCFLRTGRNGSSLLCAVNFAPLAHPKYCIGLPKAGTLKEVFSTDSLAYGGSGMHNREQILIQHTEWNGFPFRASICIPPLSCIYFTFDQSTANGSSDTFTTEGG